MARSPASILTSFHVSVPCLTYPKPQPRASHMGGGTPGARTYRRRTARAPWVACRRHRHFLPRQGSRWRRSPRTRTTTTKPTAREAPRVYMRPLPRAATPPRATDPPSRNVPQTHTPNLAPSRTKLIERCSDGVEDQGAEEALWGRRRRRIITSVLERAVSRDSFPFAPAPPAGRGTRSAPCRSRC